MRLPPFQQLVDAHWRDVNRPGPGRYLSKELGSVVVGAGGPGALPLPDEADIVAGGPMAGEVGGDPEKTLQDARFVIGDYISCAIFPPLPNGSIAPPLAPSARPLAPQVTALPPLAAYHDLRWLFAFNQPWLGFTGVLLLLVVARSAVDAVLVMLAWPKGGAGGGHSLPRPRFMASLVS